MITRMLRRRVKKLKRDFIYLNPNVMVLDTIHDLVVKYEDELEKGGNSAMEYIETPRFTRMMNKLTKKFDLDEEYDEEESDEAEINEDKVESTCIESVEDDEKQSVEHNAELSSDKEFLCCEELPAREEPGEGDEQDSLYTFRNKRLEPSGSFG
jgi:hypothetical protein